MRRAGRWARSMSRSGRKSSAARAARRLSRPLRRLNGLRLRSADRARPPPSPLPRHFSQIQGDSVAIRGAFPIHRAGERATLRTLGTGPRTHDYYCRPETSPGGIMLKRLTVFIYGLLAYVLFLGTFLYAIGFVTNLFVPRSIDAAPEGDLATNLAIDLMLLTVFALQHSAMARPAFKRVLTRVIPEPAERSTYVLASSLALIALFAFWRPLGGAVWSVEQPAAAAVLYALGAFGWGLVL